MILFYSENQLIQKVFRKLKLLKLSMQISTHVDKSIPEDSPLKKPDVMRMLMFIKLSLDQDKKKKQILECRNRTQNLFDL